jgi:hypothetical protein
MKKFLFSVACFTLFATGYANIEVIPVKPSQEITVDCTYTVRVYDKSKHEVTSYSVDDRNIDSGLPCLEAIYKEVLFLEYKYPGFTVEYELLFV